jgi:hypothetical protein
VLFEVAMGGEVVCVILPHHVAVLVVAHDQDDVRAAGRRRCRQHSTPQQQQWQQWQRHGGVAGRGVAFHWTSAPSSISSAPHGAVQRPRVVSIAQPYARGGRTAGQRSQPSASQLRARQPQQPPAPAVHDG